MKTGTRLVSQVCDGEVIVVRAEGTTIPPQAGGCAMVEPSRASQRTTVKSGRGSGFLLGKRYGLVDEDAGVRLEVLVTKAGTSTLAWEGVPLLLKGSKPLPASD
jgi:hypothetical protein